MKVKCSGNPQCGNNKCQHATPHRYSDSCNLDYCSAFDGKCECEEVTMPNELYQQWKEAFGFESYEEFLMFCLDPSFPYPFSNIIDRWYNGV